MAGSENFFTKLFASLFKSNDPDAEKKRRLKLIAKTLSKAKYHFYKIPTDEVLPSFAKLFYDIYKAIYPAKVMFQAQENPNAIKFMVVNYSLTDDQHALIDSLSEENIKAQSTTVSIQELNKSVKQNIEKLLSIFSVEKINKIESLYKKLVMFRSFCLYDFYFLLKKFDSALFEGQFTSVPKFEKINSEYVAEDLKEFLEVAWVIPSGEDWSDLVKFLKDVKGTEPVTLNIWNKILAKLRAIKTSGVFEMMIQVITKDPDYFCNANFKEPPIADTYIEKIRDEAEKALKTLAIEQQNSKRDDLLNQIFGTDAVVRLKNYSEEMSSVFEKKDLGGFTYVQPLNYYKAFLLDFVKKDVREFSDLILVRGQWTSNALQTPMSNSYHALLESSESLIAFDNKIAEDGDIGIKLKTLLPRTERDRETRNIIKMTINDLNEEARTFCVDGTKHLIVIAKTLKSVLEDYARPKGELIMNWKELEHFADHPIKELGVGVYKHIFLFVQLMQSCLTEQ